ncbi:MAG: glycosyltransferase family 39 protein [Burkholderiales bacterium]
MNRTLTARQQRWLWTLLVLAVGVRAATMGAYPLIDPSESRYAEIARKIVETGQWLVPQFDYGVPFWGKPPLSFWLTAASLWVFGVNEFAARLPSLLLMAGCGALVWRVARTHADRDTALLATAVFATTALVFVAAGAVLTDIALALGTTLSMAGFLGMLRTPSRLRNAAAFFLGLAIGLLAKGPIAVVLTALPLALWTLWQRNGRAVWTQVPWVAGTLAVAVMVVPWYWAVEIATPGFLDYFLVGEHWQRFTQPGWTGDRYGAGHAWRRGWIWLFWLAAAAPWSVVLIDWSVRSVAAPRGKLRERLADPLWSYFALWTLAPMVFFTLSRNILPSYVLPGLPALALLIAYGPLAGAAPRPLDRAETRGFVAAFVLAVAFVGILVTQLPRIDREYAQRALVRTFEAQRSDPAQRLVYLGDAPVSAAFYSQGKARQVQHESMLAPYLADAPLDYFAIRADEVGLLSPVYRQRLALVDAYGRFQLYREMPREAGGGAPPAR